MRLVSRIILLFAICNLFFVVYGCYKKEAKKADVIIPEEKRPIELVMWLVGSESQSQSINKLSKHFTQKTGVKVRCEAISWGEAHSKYLTSIAGEVTPDIGTMGLTWGTEFGSLGAMVDLAKNYAQDLATIFHSFYEKCRVVSEDNERTSARLKLVETTKIVLAKTLHLMGLRAP